MTDPGDLEVASRIKERARWPWLVVLIVTGPWAGVAAAIAGSGTPHLFPALFWAAAMVIGAARIGPIFFREGATWLHAPGLWVSAILRELFAGRPAAPVLLALGIVAEVIATR